MKILFITNLIPFPLDNGGKIKSYNTLKMLSKENDVDIYSFYENNKEFEGIEHIRKSFGEVYSVKKELTTSTNINKMVKIGLRSLTNKLPFVLLKFIDNNMSKLLEDGIKKNKYDLVYIDHLQLAVYWEVLKKANCPIYLDEHNCEAQILRRKIEVEKNFIKKCFFSLEYRKLYRFEQNIIDKSDKVIVLSEDDKLCLIDKRRMDTSKFITIPIPTECNFFKDDYKLDKTINIMFLGTLSWFPNAQGIEWFIDNVISKIEEQQLEYNLYIVGKDPNESLIRKCKFNKNIVITGYVDDVNEYIDRCDIMVVPLFVGSGMRVKILEGISKGIPIISTRIGAEGINLIDGESILYAENEEEFIQSIFKLKNHKLYFNIKRNAKIVFDKEYSLNAIQEKYKKEVLEK